MIIDTSAVVSIAMDEPRALNLLHQLHQAPKRFMSVASAAEACLLLVGRLDEGGRSDLDALLRHLKIELIPVDAAQCAVAQEAGVRFGKGRHGAALNFGDCFSYALAAVRNDELLCTGNDFAQTDIAVVRW